MTLEEHAKWRDSITDVTVGVDSETGEVRLVRADSRRRRTKESKPGNGCVDSILCRVAMRVLRIPDVQAELIRIVRDSGGKPPAPIKLNVDMRASTDEAISRLARIISRVSRSVEQRSIAAISKAFARGRL